jgi:hypothetical protein
MSLGTLPVTAINFFFLKTAELYAAAAEEKKHCVPVMITYARIAFADTISGAQRAPVNIIRLLKKIEWL